MTKPSAITKWLMQPSNFSENERPEATSLIKAYPYFVPARYLEASDYHKKQPFATSMMNVMPLYMGNWLLFHEFLESSVKPGYIPVEDAYPEEEMEESGSDVGIAGATVKEPTYGNDDFEEDSEPIDFAHFNGEDDFDDDETLDDFDDDYGFDEPEESLVGEQETTPPDPGPQTDKEQKPVIAEKEQQPVLQETRQEPAPKEPIKQPELKPEPVTKEEVKEQPAPVKEKQKEKPKEEILFYQNREPDSLIQPIYTEDYFLHQGLHVSDELPPDVDQEKKKADKSLMVVMSFSEWLVHFKTKGERQKEEQQDQKALKTMWQKEKLAAALEEENEEIPEQVFEMAVNSITKEEDLASESLAEIMVKQGKHDKAIDMYRKLSLHNPQKKAYFARKIEILQKEKES